MVVIFVQDVKKKMFCIPYSILPHYFPKCPRFLQYVLKFDPCKHQKARINDFSETTPTLFSCKTYFEYLAHEWKKQCWSFLFKILNKIVIQGIFFPDPPSVEGFLSKSALAGFYRYFFLAGFYRYFFWLDFSVTVLSKFSCYFFD